jgi:hypothetical protein
MNSKTTTAMT